MFGEFIKGANFVAQGRRLVTLPGLRPFVWVPLLLNMVLFSIGTWYGVHWVTSLTSDLKCACEFAPPFEWLGTVLSALLNLLGGVLGVIAAIMVVVVLGSCFTMATHVLAAPFLGILAERVEQELHTTQFPRHTVWQIAVRTLRREWQKLRYWLWRSLMLGLLTLVLSLLPGVNAITPVLWYLFGAWIMAIQYVDMAADNNGLPPRAVLELLRAHRSVALGFGGSVMLLTSIPLLNLFIVPIAVAGGVALWVAHQPVQGK